MRAWLVTPKEFLYDTLFHISYLKEFEGLPFADSVEGEENTLERYVWYETLSVFQIAHSERYVQQRTVFH